MSDLHESDRGALQPNRPSAEPMTFTHPDDVLHSPTLSVAEKREILAAWASDAHAVPSLPALRQLDSGAIVALDTVLEALLNLDDAPPRPSFWAAPIRRPRSLTLHWRHRLRRHHDHDDDPPPAPASALPPGVELELRRRRDAQWAGAAA